MIQEHLFNHISLISGHFGQKHQKFGYFAYRPPPKASQTAVQWSYCRQIGNICYLNGSTLISEYYIGYSADKMGTFATNMVAL